MSDSELQKAVNKVIAKEPGWKKAIEPPAPAQPIPAARGTGASNIAAKGAPAGTGGGLSAPFTEPNAATRVYWTQREIRSSDGVLSFVVRPIRNVLMVDGAAVSVPWNFADPPA